MQVKLASMAKVQDSFGRGVKDIYNWHIYIGCLLLVPILFRYHRLEVTFSGSWKFWWKFNLKMGRTNIILMTKTIDM